MRYDVFWGAPVPFDATGPDSTAGDDIPEHWRYFDGGKTKFTINQSGRFWGAQVEHLRGPKEIFPGIFLIPTHSPYLGSHVTREKVLWKVNFSTKLMIVKIPTCLSCL